MPRLPTRRSVRLPTYDYASAGAYFVTICTYERALLFGAVSGGEMQKNELGRCVEDQWSRMLKQRPNVQSEAFTVMPNHIHALFVLHPRSEAELPPNVVLGLRAHSVSAVIATFKAGVTREARRSGIAEGPIWQRSFHEHVVRSERAFDQIRRYIHENPLRWEMDRYHASS